MRILVTGGAGFIGSNLVDRLLVDGHEVAVVDDLSGGDRANLVDAAQSPRFALHVMDIRDPALIGLAAEWKPEVICHLAAQVSVRRSVADPVHDARLNVEGTASVLTAAHHGGTRKVILASSVAVYGRPAVIPVPADAATDPRSPYAASKLSAETYLAAFKALYDIDYTALVLSNVYGPRQSPDGEAGVVAIFTDALLKGTPTVRVRRRHPDPRLRLRRRCGGRFRPCLRRRGKRPPVQPGHRRGDLRPEAALPGGRSGGGRRRAGRRRGAPGRPAGDGRGPGSRARRARLAPSDGSGHRVKATVEWARAASRSVRRPQPRPHRSQMAA